jgi:hypothetical protein
MSTETDPSNQEIDDMIFKSRLSWLSGEWLIYLCTMKQRKALELRVGLPQPWGYLHALYRIRMANILGRYDHVLFEEVDKMSLTWRNGRWDEPQTLSLSLNGNKEFFNAARLLSDDITFQSLLLVHEFTVSHTFDEQYMCRILERIDEPSYCYVKHLAVYPKMIEYIYGKDTNYTYGVKVKEGCGPGIFRKWRLLSVGLYSVLCGMNELLFCIV